MQVWVQGITQASSSSFVSQLWKAKSTSPKPETERLNVNLPCCTHTLIWHRVHQEIQEQLETQAKTECRWILPYPHTTIFYSTSHSSIIPCSGSCILYLVSYAHRTRHNSDINSPCFRAFLDIKVHQDQRATLEEWWVLKLLKRNDCKGCMFSTAGWAGTTRCSCTKRTKRIQGTYHQ